MKDLSYYTHNKYLKEYNCCELCGRVRHLELHHIVPTCVGGPDEIDNWIAICRACHARLTPTRVLTKLGLKNCEKQLGGKKGVKLNIKKAIESKEQILKLSKDFDGSMKDSELIKKLGIARNSFYKYKKELKEGE